MFQTEGCAIYLVTQVSSCPPFLSFSTERSCIKQKRAERLICVSEGYIHGFEDFQLCVSAEVSARENLESQCFTLSAPDWLLFCGLPERGF